MSAIDEAALMVARVHATWSEAHIAGIHLMDIMAAFLSVRRGREIHPV